MANAEHSFIPYKDKPSPEKLEEVAREELGETEESKQRCLEELKLLIRENKVTCCMTDDFLLRFLRVRKYQTRRSFEALRNYAYQRKFFNKGLQELRTEVLEHCIRQKIMGFLPYRDPEQRRIYFMHPANWNPNIISIKEMSTLYFLFANHAAEEEATQIIGFITLYDARSMPVTHLFHFLPYGNRWKNLVFNSLPARYQKAHVITNSLVLKLVRLIVLPLMPKKIVDRVVFHEDVGETLFKYIPARILPDEIGGTLGPLNTEDILKTMVEYLKKVKDDYQYFQQDT